MFDVVVAVVLGYGLWEGQTGRLITINIKWLRNLESNSRNRDHHRRYFEVS